MAHFEYTIEKEIYFLDNIYVMLNRVF